MLSGAKSGPFPGFVKPQLATPRNTVSASQGWLHEIKFDGYPIQGHLIQGRPALVTRNGHDWTHRMPALAKALARIPALPELLSALSPSAKGGS
jgi:bifunctional non-homologous end joining protein LigD